MAVSTGVSSKIFAKDFLVNPQKGEAATYIKTSWKFPLLQSSTNYSSCLILISVFLLFPHFSSFGSLSSTLSPCVSFQDHMFFIILLWVALCRVHIEKSNFLSPFQFVLTSTFVQQNETFFSVSTLLRKQKDYNYLELNMFCPGPIIFVFLIIKAAYLQCKTLKNRDTQKAKKKKKKVFIIFPPRDNFNTLFISFQNFCVCVCVCVFLTKLGPS